MVFLAEEFYVPTLSIPLLTCQCPYCGRDVGFWVFFDLNTLALLSPTRAAAIHSYSVKIRPVRGWTGRHKYYPHLLLIILASPAMKRQYLATIEQQQMSTLITLLSLPLLKTHAHTHARTHSLTHTHVRTYRLFTRSCTYSKA